MNHYMRGSGVDWQKLRFTRKIVDGFEVPYLKEDPMKGVKIKPIKPKKIQTVYLSIRDSMKTSHSWVDHWPAPRGFNRNIIPLPLYQGFVKQKKKNVFIPPPNSAGNLELLKVTNFLHLTPDHIKSQCELLKDKYCTYLPKGKGVENIINEEMPIDLVTNDFVLDSPNGYYEKSRKAVLKVNIDRLGLKPHEKRKLISILKERYDPITLQITLKADKCPLRKQNIDYCFYLLYVLYCEAKKIYDWEKDVVLEDLPEYQWEKGTSREMIESIKKNEQQLEIRHRVTKNEHWYKKCVKQFNDEQDSCEAEQNYKDCVKRMIGIS